jgi:hypothetical protein
MLLKTFIANHTHLERKYEQNVINNKDVTFRHIQYYDKKLKNFITLRIEKNNTMLVIADRIEVDIIHGETLLEFDYGGLSIYVKGNPIYQDDYKSMTDLYIDFEHMGGVYDITDKLNGIDEIIKALEQNGLKK